MTYSNYTALDFAMDEHFQRWVFTQDAEVTHYWKNWLELHPEKKNIVEEGRLLLHSQTFKQHQWSEERILAIQERIRKSMAVEKPKTYVSTPKQNKKPGNLSNSWMAIAASALLLTTLAISLLFFGKDEQVFSTTYGETQQMLLPDGSEVILNANSRLRFAKNWQEKEHRQVWLEGEAFFKVSRIASSSKEAVKFVVHLEDIDVEVVGTSFNVNHRAGKIEVTLDEGIVDLKMTGGERLRMEPGDMVAYSSETQRLDKSNANLEKVTAWKNHQMMLDGQPLSDLAMLIKDYYGVEVRFSSEELADRKIKTTLPTDNLELVLETLELVLDVQSERKGDEIMMK